MEFVLAVIVGLLSGALGSILAPLVTHRLSRRQREEQRAEQRHSELRDMIEEVMAEARLSLGDNFLVGADARMGFAPQKAYERYLKRITQRMEKASRRHIWRPHRIDDAELRKLADSLMSTDDKLAEFDETIRVVSPQEIDDWIKRGLSIASELEGLLEKVDVRLDQLGW